MENLADCGFCPTVLLSYPILAFAGCSVLNDLRFLFRRESLLRILAALQTVLSGNHIGRVVLCRANGQVFRMRAGGIVAEMANVLIGLECHFVIALICESMG
jgi:hypothetical protein